MTPLELHGILAQQFGRAVGEWKEAKAGDNYIYIAPERLYEVCSYLKNEAECSFDFLRLLSSVDWGDRFGVIYHLYSYARGHSLVLHADLRKEEPRISSVSSIWPTAEWLEREAFDMMGICFDGHPYLKRILLPLDWEGHPLRKDYKDPEEYHGVKHD